MSAAIQPYTLLDDDDCESRILRARETLGERLVILVIIISAMKFFVMRILPVTH